MVYKSQQDMVQAFMKVAKHHVAEPDIPATCKLMEKWSNRLVEKIKPFVQKYGEEKNSEPDRLLRNLFKEPCRGSMGLLRDLHDLWLMANEAEVSSIVLQQTAFGLRDKELIGVCDEINIYAKRALTWLLTRMKSIATQTLIVAK
ncbi:MAG TPA: hypothetical protein VM187_08065 [Niastella sp.]|nr:hypothetical protein [Niastella sp.]